MLEVAATILAAAIVEDEDNIAFLGHVGFPGARGPVPGGLHVVGVGSAIDIDHGGVLFIGVEVSGLHHPVIEVCRAISRLDTATFEDGLYVTCPGVIGLQEVRMKRYLLGQVYHINDKGSCGGRESVDEVVARWRQFSVMDTIHRFQLFDFSLHAHAVQTVMQGMLLVGFDDNAFLFLVEEILIPFVCLLPSVSLHRQ